MSQQAKQLTVITGASSGIGEACARDLHRRGHRLHLLARREQRLQALKAEFGTDCDFSVLDVRDLKEVDTTFRMLLERYGQIDNLVLSAGYSIFGKVAHTSVEEIKDLVESNYMGRVACAKAVAPAMIQAGKGNICVIASITGQLGFPNYAPYGASHAAVIGYFRALYHELRPHGVHVGIVLPSGTDTEFFDHPSYQRQAETRFYSKQAPGIVAKAVTKCLEGKKRELTRPRHMGWAVSILSALWPFSRPLIAYLNPGDEDA